jgi:hypothetical protein
MIPTAIFGTLLVISAFVVVYKVTRGGDDDHTDFPDGYR